MTMLSLGVIVFFFLMIGYQKHQDSVISESDESQVLMELDPAVKQQQHKEFKDTEDKKFDVVMEYKQIVGFSPVVIFTKSSSVCTDCNTMAKLLQKEYQITPPPAFVELDKHPHGDELQKHIGRITGRSVVPHVFVNGVTRGSADDILDLHNSGDLSPTFQRWGGNELRVKRLSTKS